LFEGTTSVNVESTGDHPGSAGSDIISQDINGEVCLVRVIWNSDPEFQTGLILNPNPGPSPKSQAQIRPDVYLWSPI